METTSYRLGARSRCEMWLLLVIVMSDMTNGGVQGPIDGFNSLDEHMSGNTAAVAMPTAMVSAIGVTTTTMTSTLGFESGEANGAATSNSNTFMLMHPPPNWVDPYFDPSTPRNVTALMGKSAYLSCRVRNLGNKTVSWIRHRDIHILTVGSYTYTSDQRFQATHHQDTDDWTLQIKWAQKRDAGMYECQISTQPVRSYFVRLNVVVPTATILGGPDLHVDKGSTINLTCTVKFSPEPPAYIFWYHHEEVINYDSSRGGVSVITEKGDVTTSFLLIQNADLADSGKYSCAPSNADVASVRVHVLNGEHPEAMQTGSSGCHYNWLTIFLLVCLVLCCNQQQFTMQQVSANNTAATSTKDSMRTCGLVRHSQIAGSKLIASSPSSAVPTSTLTVTSAKPRTVTSRAAPSAMLQVMYISSMSTAPRYTIELVDNVISSDTRSMAIKSLSDGTTNFSVNTRKQHLAEFSTKKAPATSAMRATLKESTMLCLINTPNSNNAITFSNNNNNNNNSNIVMKCAR